MKRGLELIQAGHILINGVPCKNPNYIIRRGDRLRVSENGGLGAAGII
jgi:ribosomal protein S4